MNDPITKCPICDKEFTYYHGGHGQNGGTCPEKHYDFGGSWSGQTVTVYNENFHYSCHISEEVYNERLQKEKEAIAKAREERQKETR